MEKQIPYYCFWNPAQRRPKPPVSKLDEAKKRYVLSTLKDIPESGMNAQVLTTKTSRRS